MKSPAYRDLKPPARCLLDELQLRAWPLDKNGRISMGTAEAAKLLNVTERTARKAFYELVRHGFIVMTKDRLWQQRKAREWRITFLPFVSNRPTDDWKSWEPGNPLPVPFRPPE